MGVLPRRNDLRGHQRDPEGHRGLAPARPAQGALMDPDERTLLNETLLGLAAAERTGQLTVALDAFGWRDVLAAHPRRGHLRAVRGARPDGDVVCGAARRPGRRRRDARPRWPGQRRPAPTGPRLRRARWRTGASRSRASSSDRGTRQPRSSPRCGPRRRGHRRRRSRTRRRADRAASGSRSRPRGVRRVRHHGRNDRCSPRATLARRGGRPRRLGARWPCAGTSWLPSAS